MGFFSWVGRTAEVFGQGVVRGVSSGFAAVGDFAVDVGYNWTTRNAINAFRGDGNQLESYDTNWADQAAEAVTWTEPRNSWERGVMTTGQVVGEIAGFAATTVATAGVGGAVYGAARTGAAATRIGSAVSTGLRAASTTGRIMNPVATRAAAAIEAGFGGYRGVQIYNNDAQAEQTADTLRSDAGTEAIDTAADQQEFINDVLLRQKEELQGIVSEINGGGLSEEREAALRGRIEEIRDERALIDGLSADDLDPAGRERIIEQLRQAYPGLDANEAAAGVVSAYTRSEQGGELTRSFAAGGRTQPAGTDLQHETTGPGPNARPLTPEVSQ